MNKSIMKGMTILLALSFISSVVSCSSKDNQDPAPPIPVPRPEVKAQQGPYFIAVKTSSASGEEYILQVPSITAGDLNIRDNIKELEQKDYTWVFDRNVAVGFAYGYASAGYGYAMWLRNEQTKLEDLNNFRIEPKYTSYGFFNHSVITMVGGQVSSDGKRNDLAVFTEWTIGQDGVKRSQQKAIPTRELLGNEQQVTFSGVADQGDGTFLSAMIASEFKNVGVGDGSSIGKLRYPDSVWVAKLDGNLNVVKVYGDSRLSFAAGRWHAQNFNMVLPTSSPTRDTTYVFSSAIDSTTSRHAGALRFTKQNDGFDPSYYWDLQQAFGGYKFRRVWHVTDDIYLLEFYNTFNPGNTSVAHQYALADMSAKKITEVKGLPAKNMIKSGEQTGGAPLYDNGVLYLPITVYGSDAVIYSINPYTGEAKKGITLHGVGEVRSLGKLRGSNN